MDLKERAYRSQMKIPFSLLLKSHVDSSSVTLSIAIDSTMNASTPITHNSAGFYSLVLRNKQTRQW